MIPLVMTTFGKLGPSGESYLRSLADVACSTGFVDRGVWLRVAKQFLSRGSGSWRFFSSVLKEHCEVCWEGLS